MKRIISAFVLMASMSAIANDQIGGTLIYENTSLKLLCVERNVDNKCVRAEVEQDFCNKQISADLSDVGMAKMNAKLNGVNQGLENRYEKASDIAMRKTGDSLAFVLDHTIPESTPEQLDTTIRVGVAIVPMIGAIAVDVVKYPILSASHYVHTKVNKKIMKSNVKFLLDESKVGEEKNISKLNMFHLLNVLESSNFN